MNEENDIESKVNRLFEARYSIFVQLLQNGDLDSNFVTQFFEGIFIFFKLRNYRIKNRDLLNYSQISESSLYSLKVQNWEEAYSTCNTKQNKD